MRIFSPHNAMLRYVLPRLPMKNKGNTAHTAHAIQRAPPHLTAAQFAIHLVKKLAWPASLQQARLNTNTEKERNHPIHHALSGVRIPRIHILTCKLFTLYSLIISDISHFSSQFESCGVLEQRNSPCRGITKTLKIQGYSIVCWMICGRLFHVASRLNRRRVQESAAVSASYVVLMQYTLYKYALSPLFLIYGRYQTIFCFSCGVFLPFPRAVPSSLP